ncbi:MAG: pseudoazurin [Pseudomonadota bacterium]
MKSLLLVICFSLVFTNALAETHTVKMRSKTKDEKMVYEPAFLKVEVGDVIVFEPTDSGHNSKSVFYPKAAQAWDSKIDEKIEITLTEEGIYIYECTPHVSTNMVGVIQVGEAKNLKQAKKFADDYPKFISFNKSRITEYLKKAK